MRKLLILLMIMSLSACVTVQKPKPIIINGAAGYLQKILLPMDSMFTVAIIDLDTPGVILAQKTFNVATQPIGFKFTIPAEAIDKKVNYGVVALIKNQDRVIFQTYNRYPIINNGKTTVEVIMQPAK
ncbi:YbaY family lipoprotein [Parashewanella tropica]|uniref:YbaY family lipoprotein n=1 Tax=Parashewanella tropica TaxID=2547970 RepID=UPI0010597077|nr:YbaY family lipoprotein [Parashewanella tropica]